MDYKSKATGELLTDISRGKQESVKIYSVGRNVIKSIPSTESSSL